VSWATGYYISTPQMDGLSRRIQVNPWRQTEPLQNLMHPQTTYRQGLVTHRLSRIVCAALVIATWSTTVSAQSASFTDFHSGPATPALAAGAPGQWDERIHEKVAILEEDGIFKMWYVGHPATGQLESKIGYATSSDGVTWTKHPSNPINDRGLMQQNISVLKTPEGTYWMYVEVANQRIDLLTSTDGLNWTADQNPIMTEAAGPVVWREESDWFMLYENRTGAVPSIHLATSLDGRTWVDNPANPVISGPGYTQPDSIVKDGSTYHLYWHTTDAAAWYATSQDLVNWTNHQKLLNGYFSQFTYRRSNGEIRSYVVIADNSERKVDLRYGQYTQFPLIWHLDEGGGDLASGAPGGGMYGELLNGASWSGGVVGSGITFDGTNDYIRTDFRRDLNVWTVTAFVQGHAAPTSGPATGPVQRLGAFQITWDHPDPAFRGAAALKVPSGWHAASFGPLTGQTWYHLAATYDGETLRAYTNGMLISSNTSVSGAPDPEPLPLLFGRNTTRDQFFRGSIDEVRLYDTVLTDSEINALSTIEYTPPSPPSGLSASVNGQQVSLSWTAPAGPPPSSFRVYRGISGDLTLSLLGQVSSSVTIYLDTATAPNTTYIYEVRSVAGPSLESTPSNSVTALTGDTPPASPTALVATGGVGQIVLDWADNIESDLAGYRVYRSAIPGGPYTQIGSMLTSVSTLTDTSVAEGTFYYVVTSVDNGGHESPASTEASATVVITQPGVAGHWELNEGSGTMASDTSGNGRHATLLNGPVWTSGVIGGGLSFDGVDDYMSAPFAQNLTTWSVAVWVRSTAAPANAVASGPVQKEAAFQINWNHPDSPYRGAAALRVAGNWFAASFGPMSGDTWYHLAATYDGDTLRAYRNGVLVASNTAPSGPPDVDTQPVFFGRHATRDRFFSGSIDDVRIYDHVLDASEIAALGAAGADATPPGTATLTSMVVGQTVSLSWTAASDPESGIAQYRIRRGASSGVEKSEIAQVAGTTLVFSDNETAPNTPYYYDVVALNGAGLSGAGSNEIAAVTGNVAPGAPTGLTAVANGSDVALDWVDSPEIDLEGYRVYRSTTPGGPYTAVGPSLITTSSLIDPGLVYGTTYHYVVTAVDTSDLDSVVSAEVSAAVLNVEPGLVGHWSLDDGAGTIAEDTSGGGAHAVLQNGAAWAAGMFAGAVSLDGVDDFISTPFPQSLSSWTVSVWVFSPAAPSSGLASGPVQREANLQINWNHPDPVFRGAAALRVGGNWYAASFGTLAPNTWYHLAATYDGETLRAYRDGVLVTSNAQPSGASDADTQPIYFGRHSTRERFFVGAIDEVRIYDRALNAADISTLAVRPQP
jgi:fibronectin type 3 domain-containing protein